MLGRQIVYRNINIEDIGNLKNEVPIVDVSDDLELKDLSNIKLLKGLPKELSDKIITSDEKILNIELRKREYSEMSPSAKKLLLNKRQLQYEALDAKQHQHKKQKGKNRFDNLSVEEQNKQRLSEKQNFENLNIQQKTIQRLNEATHVTRSLKLRKKNMSYRNLSKYDKDAKNKVQQQKIEKKRRNLTITQKKHINVARKLHKFINSEKTKQSNLTIDDIRAIRGETKLIDLDLRFVTEEDFKIILQLDELNDKGVKDGMLVYLVKDSLRVNNYILSFLRVKRKVRNNSNEEQIILDLVNSVSNFSFRTTEKYYNIDSDLNSNEIILNPSQGQNQQQLRPNKNYDKNIDPKLNRGQDLNFLTSKEIEFLEFAKKLRKFLIEYQSRKVNLNSNDQEALDGKLSLHLLDLRFVPKSDFF